MSNQPHSSRPTWRASYRQLRPEEFRAPDLDNEANTNIHTAPSSPSQPPILEPPDTTIAEKNRPRPNIFKAGPFSRLPIQGSVTPARPLGYKPKPLHELEITDLYPDDEPNNETAPLFHGGAARDPATATRRSSQQKEPRLPPSSPPFTILSLTDSILDSPLSLEFFEEHSRFLNSLSDADAPSATLPNSNYNSNAPSLNSSYRPLPLPAALNQHHHQPILPLYTSPSPSEISLLRPQSFLSFLYEYTITFFNYVFDIDVSSKGLYGLSRSRTNRNTCYYGTGEREGGGEGQGQRNQVLRDQERQGVVRESE